MHCVQFEQARDDYLEALARLAPLDAEKKARFPEMGRRFGRLRGREIGEWERWVETTRWDDLLEDLERAETRLRLRFRAAEWVLWQSRETLRELVALAIDRMDAMDGDPDLEPEEDRCEAGDDGCGLFSRWRGGTWWGSTEDAGKELPVPRYGVDQTGPIIGH
jgi:hypothetical protein